jgi:hypothetical protein
MTGMYYTPKEIQKIADPSTGTGAFLKIAADGLSNPPYGFPTQHAPDRLRRGLAVVLVVVIVLLAVALVVIGGR